MHKAQITIRRTAQIAKFARLFQSEFDPETVYTQVHLKQYTVSFGDTNVQTYITVAKDSEILESMIDMHERVSGEKLSLANGTVCTEKLATLLGAQAGDEITIRISDQESCQAIRLRQHIADSCTAVYESRVP
jgi:hypothetical protein